MGPVARRGASPLAGTMWPRMPSGRVIHSFPTAVEIERTRARGERGREGRVAMQSSGDVGDGGPSKAGKREGKAQSREVEMGRAEQRWCLASDGMA